MDLSGFDDEDKIYLSEDTIVHFFLNVDKKLDDADLEEIQSYDQFAQGKSLALYYISFKMRTSSEVRKYLSEHEIDNTDQIDEVINVLTKNNLINDKAYAENFIEGKISMGSAGPVSYTHLAKKVLASSIIFIIDSKSFGPAFLI